MSELTKNQLKQDNTNSFPNNNTGYITPAILRDFNNNMIDSLVSQPVYTAESASFNSRINDLDPSGSQQSFAALEAATASLNAYTASQNSFNNSATASIVALQSFSSSLDATFATDAQLTALSTSIAVTDNAQSASIAALQQFSSSLDATFATDVQLSASVAALSSSVAVTDLAQSASIAQLQQFSSSLDNTFATDAQLNAATAALELQINTKLSTASYQTDSASFDGRINSIVVTPFLSQSVFNSYTASNDSKVNSLISKTGSYATTGSNTFNGSQSITGSVSLTGNITATSASFQYVETIFETASVIYSSGSNQFGDAANDVQTLYGSVRVMNSLTASGLNYPTADGTFSGQVLQTNAAGTLSFGNVNAVFENIRNGEATQITTGTPLYVSGAQGDTPIVYRADASNPAKMPVTFLAMENIASNATGRGITLGLITGINMTGYPVGTQLWVDGLGLLTSQRPTGSTDIVQPIAIVTKTGNGGQINVLNPGPVLLPNLPNGRVWVGDINNQPVANPLNQLTVLSSSYAETASFALAVQGFDSSSLVTSASFNAYTSSNDGKVNSLISKTGSYATTGSNTFQGQQNFQENVRVASDKTLFTNKIQENTGGIIYFQGDLQAVNPATHNVIADLIGTASFATTASFALNATSVDTSSLVSTSSFNSYTASNDSKVNSLISATGSYVTEAESGSFVTSVLAGGTPKEISVTKGDGTTNTITINNVDSASYATTASFALNAGASVDTGSFATTGSNTFNGNQTITGSVRVDGDLILDDDGGTTSILLNQKFSTEFLGAFLRWQEANKKVTLEAYESEVQFALSAYSASYDNGLIIDVKSDGTTLSDYNTSFVNQPWLKIPVNSNNNPPVQFPRGAGITGSLSVSGSSTFGGQSIFNGVSVFNTPLTASAARINGNIVATGDITASNITATSASFQYVQTIYETSSIIFSSGSNQLGDELSDVQTLSGSVKVQGELLVNGVPVQTSSFDASGYLLTSSFNSYTQSNDSKVNSLIAATGSYAISSSVATITGNSLVTASISGDTITFTKGNGSTFPIVVPTGSGSVPAGTVSSSAQIAEFGYATTGSNTFNGGQNIAGTLDIQQASNPLIYTSIVQDVLSNRLTLSQVGADGFRFLGDITASGYDVVADNFIGTASYSNETVSASFAQTASFLLGSIESASFAQNANLLDGKDSTEFATTSSNVFVGNQIVSASLYVRGGDVNYISNNTTLNPDLYLTESLAGQVNIIKGWGENPAAGGAGATQANYTGSLRITGSNNTVSLPQIRATATGGGADMTGYISGSDNVIAGNLAGIFLNSGSQLFPKTATNYVTNNSAILMNFTTSSLSGGHPIIQNNNLFAGQITFNHNSGSLAAASANIINGGAITSTQNFVTNTRPAVSTNIINGIGININHISSSVSFQSNIANSGLTINNHLSSSGLTNNGLSFTNNVVLGGSSNTPLGVWVSGSQASNANRTIIDNLIGGKSNIVSSSFVSSSNSSLVASLIYGQNLVVNGNNSTTSGGSTFVGRFNDSGSLANSQDIVFAVGTGLGTATRRTGMWIDSGSNAVISGSFRTIGNATFTGSVDVTGSVGITGSFSARIPTASNESQIDLFKLPTFVGANGTTYPNASISLVDYASSGIDQTFFIEYANADYQKYTALQLGPSISSFMVGKGSGYNYDVIELKDNNDNTSTARIKADTINLIGATNVTGSQLSLNNNGGLALKVYSGSVEVTSPQGTGYFYTNLPLTSSAARINGTALVSDLIVSGVFAGNSSLQVMGNSSFTGSIFASSSVVGSVNDLTISSQTASLDLSKGNFFTIQLVSGSSTHINPTNIAAGQTISLRLNTTGSGTVTFANSIKQASGSAYVPTTGTGVDVITLISFDTQSLYISNLKNFS